MYQNQFEENNYEIDFNIFIEDDIEFLDDTKERIKVFKKSEKRLIDSCFVKLNKYYKNKNFEKFHELRKEYNFEYKRMMEIYKELEEEYSLLIENYRYSNNNVFETINKNDKKTFKKDIKSYRKQINYLDKRIFNFETELNISKIKENIELLNGIKIKKPKRIEKRWRG